MIFLSCSVDTNADSCYITSVTFFSFRIKIMEINGFTFSSRLIGTSACYHVAKRGDIVYTSKDMKYLIRKVKATTAGSVSK